MKPKSTGTPRTVSSLMTDNQHQSQQVDFLMIRERQKDLVQLVAAILSNSNVYPARTENAEVLVNIAVKIMDEIENRAKS